MSTVVGDSATAPMRTFFPALENRLLTKLFTVCVLMLLATLAAFAFVRRARAQPDTQLKANAAPLFIMGGTQAPSAAIEE